ncbi:MAG: polymorphic toxin type 23 domain-containing protein [Bacteroidales bacterium]|nr:polymorphic toxin type 23 domain-containing protein [Bacteroidales bacterium]
MNGRNIVYPEWSCYFGNPITGRMLSPDNYIQAPDFSQSFNRYSYAWNNPLVFTDPDGEIFMVPFFVLAMVADYTSNLINGYHDPLGKAYKNVTSTISGINNAVQIPVYQNQNSNITIGLNPFSFGITANASFRSDNFIYSLHGGFGFFGADFGATTTILSGDFLFSFGGGYNRSWTNLTSSNPQLITGYQTFGGVSYYDRKQGQQFSFGLTSFFGSYSQKNWFIGYRKGDFSITMTNDAFTGSDWYRTAAAEIGIGDLSFGFNLVTTEPPLEEYKRKPKQLGGDSEYKSPIHGKNPLGTYSTGSRVFAGMYLGYRNGNRVSRFGIDAAWVQDLFQNGIHRWVVPTPYFNTNYGSPSAPFLQGGYVNPFSLYPF